MTAEEYARLRITQMVRAGLLASMPRPGPGGYAALWRGLSGSIAAPAAASGFADPGFWLRQTAHTPMMGTPAPGPSLHDMAPPSITGMHPDLIREAALQHLAGSITPPGIGTGMPHPYAGMNAMPPPNFNQQQQLEMELQNPSQMPPPSMYHF